MSRSIFPIRTFYNFNLFLINFIFSLFLYLFEFFDGGFVSCDDLIKIVYNNINIRYSSTLSSIRLYASVDFFQNYILNIPSSQFRFNIYRYLQLNGLRFPYNCVYDHYHINLYLDNMYNVHYGCSLTHHPEKLNLLPDEYRELSESDLYNERISQYILNNLHIYDTNLLKFQDFTNIFDNYIKTNNNQCINQFQKSIFIKK